MCVGGGGGGNHYTFKLISVIIFLQYDLLLLPGNDIGACSLCLCIFIPICYYK